EAVEESREATEEPPEAGCDSEAEYEELEPRGSSTTGSGRATQICRASWTKDFITCLAVHSKCSSCVGTNWGNIYILDHMGNNIQGRISVDEKGEYLASCSMDERVIIHNLFNKKTYSTLKLDKPVYAVAISPNFAATQSYVTGGRPADPGWSLASSRSSTRVLAEARPNCGAIRCIVWANSLVVWGTEEGVRAYCLASDEANFIAAFRRSVYICRIAPDPNSGRRVGQIVASFSFPMTVCGICGFGKELLLLSQKEKEKPQLHLVEPGIDTYVELARLRSSRCAVFERYSPANFRFEQLRSEGMYFIVCPKDIICAQQRDRSDHLQWLLSRGKFKQALDDVQQGGSIGEFTAASVGRKYIDHLLSVGQFGQAAELCQTVLSGKEEWEAMAYQFHQAGRLHQHLPKSKPQLDTSVYDLVLNEVFKTDREQFLELINSWPSNLFSVRAVTRPAANDQILNRCLARLYELSGEHEKTLSILLKLRSCDAFALVRRHRLHSHVVNKLPLLFNINRERTLQMLLDDQLHHLRAVIDSGLLRLSGAVHLKDPARYELALALCADRQLTEETVYILARMGRRRTRLNLLLDEQQFRPSADPELWMAAAEAASDRPRLITTLLENSGSEVDPAILIHKIQPAWWCRPQKLHCEAAQRLPGWHRSHPRAAPPSSLRTARTSFTSRSRSPPPPNVCESQQQSVRSLPNSPAGCQADGEAPPDAGEAHLLLFNCGHYFHGGVPPGQRGCRKSGRSCSATCGNADAMMNKDQQLLLKACGLMSVASALRLLWQGSPIFLAAITLLAAAVAFALADEGQSWERLLRCLISNAEAPPSSVLRRHREAELRRSVESLKSEILEACLASWLRPLSAGPDSPELARTLGEARRALTACWPGWRPAGGPRWRLACCGWACRFLAARFRAIDEGEGESGGRLLADCWPDLCSEESAGLLTAAVNTGLTHLLPPQEAACGPLRQLLLHSLCYR
uniref:Vacuolar protein sorting-associated protein 41 homolog n=1 Tax=Macrostomum lignano TaxID=282301 RepID=A0A1I8FLZ6_9PLAT